MANAQVGGPTEIPAPTPDQPTVPPVESPQGNPQPEVPPPMNDPAQLSEERRLAYVGITRAKRRLYLTCAEMRMSWGRPMSNPPSRFIGEIPAEFIDWQNG